MGAIYDRFRQLKKTSSKNAFMNKIGLVKFEQEGTCYEIYFTRKRANRYSVIHCKDNTVEWQQFPVLPRIAGTMHGKIEPILRLSPTKTCARILVISGKPNHITGLDEGVFRSVHRYHNEYINVMSEACFKTL